MSAEHPLNIVADILEKTATYMDALEADNARLSSEKAAQQDAELQKEAETLAQKVKHATGTDVNVDTMKKIAQTGDDDIKALITKLASFEDAEQMGSAQSSMTKVAGSTPPEDARFLNWVLGK